MKLLKNVKSIVEKCDFFCPTQFFRYKKEPQYQTVLGGTVSIILMLVLVIAFSSKLIATLNMMSISSSFSSENADDPKEFQISTFGEEQRNFMFGVQIWHFNLNDGPTRYFDIVLTNTDYIVGQPTQNSTQYALEQCTLDHWKGYPSILEKFDRLSAHYWLCLPKDHNFKIKGKYSSIRSNTLDVAVRKCSSQSLDPRPCASQSEIDQFFIDYGHKVFFTIYFTNPLVNPDDPNYLTYYLEDRNYMIFSQKGGEQAQLLMEDYEIITDESITPLENMVSKTGGIIQDTAIKNRYEIGPDQSIYCTFFIFKSPLSIKINRSYQKLDEIFSYIGGLLGTIVMLLFIVKSYNGYSFEIVLGSYLYKHDEVKEGFKKYNFLYFLAQLIYSPFKTKLKSIQCWDRVRRYHHCRQEVLKQMDILYLLKRVGFLERAIQVIFDQHQIKGIHLMRKLTLEEVKYNRKQFKALSAIHYKEDSNSLKSDDKQLNKQMINNNPIVANSQIKHAESLSMEESNRSPQSDDDSSSSSQGQGQTPQIPTQEGLLHMARRFKQQKQTSALSKRIYQGLDTKIKTVLEKNEQIQNISRLSNHKQFYFLQESIDMASNNPSNAEISKERMHHIHD